MKKCFLGLIAGLFMITTFQAQPTFTQDIAPIVFDNCSVCHRAGEIGPMPLTNYQEVKNWASMIQYVTEIKYMPPWPPEKTYSTLLEERGLTDQEIQLIADWVAGGMLQGDPALAPEFPEFPTGSQVGEPDLVLSFAEAFEHAGDNKDQYQIIVLPTGLTEDRIVKAIELRPGNSKIVHHAIFGLDVTGQARIRDEQTPEYGYPSFGAFGVNPEELYAGYVPGTKARKYPVGVGSPMYAGSDLLIQMHYAPVSATEYDSSTVNIFFADPGETIDRHVQHEVMLPLSSTLLNGPFYMLPGEIKTFHGVWEVPHKISLLGITPHMHLLGKGWEVYAVSPVGDTTNLIQITDWNFNWQGTYFFDRYQVLEAGTKVHALATYDNSAENPMNPNDPPAFVTWGEGTRDEMYFLPLTYVAYQAGDEDLTFTDDVLADVEGVGAPISNNAIEVIFPNPAEEELNVGFSLSRQSRISIEILDVNGRFVRSIVQQALYPAGKQLERGTISDLESGVYLLRVQGSDFSLSEPFTVIR